MSDLAIFGFGLFVTTLVFCGAAILVVDSYYMTLKQQRKNKSEVPHNVV